MTDPQEKIPEKITEIKTADAPKKRSTLKLLIVLFVFSFIFGGVYWAYLQGKEMYLGKQQAEYQPIVHDKAAANSSANSADYAQDDTADAPVDIMVSPMPPLVGDSAPPRLDDGAAVAPQQLPEDVLAKSAELVKSNNRTFILYMASRDLRESVGNNERFRKELSFVRAVSIDYPELQSKVEILEIAANDGIATKESLLADIAKLHEQLRNKNHGSFIVNLENSLSRLISITKIEGDVSSNDYNSIIKRAELAVQKDNLQLAGTELSKLGADAAPIVEKIKNISNVNDIVEYIVDFAKAKIVSK